MHLTIITQTFIVILAYAHLANDNPSSTTTAPPSITSQLSSSEGVRGEASKCLVNLVAKNKEVETMFNEKFEGTRKIMGALRNEVCRED